MLALNRSSTGPLAGGASRRPSSRRLRPSVSPHVAQGGPCSRSHRITGGGGIQLNVVEAGNAHGHPILFIHGFSQCWLTWSRQLNSDLSGDFRLVAVDLRGHGLSDKPRDAYGDSRLWADDINAVIRTLRLDHPILCSWSYGLVPLDYIRHYGDEEIGGLHCQCPYQAWQRRCNVGSHSSDSRSGTRSICHGC